MPENATSSTPTSTEDLLLKIWRNILKNDSCGVDDDFLSLGGDSLSAMLCISRVRKLVGVELELMDFFLEPATISRLASIIDAKGHGESPGPEK
jgi:acyl carrier protein